MSIHCNVEHQSRSKGSPGPCYNYPGSPIICCASLPCTSSGSPVKWAQSQDLVWKSIQQGECSWCWQHLLTQCQSCYARDVGSDMWLIWEAWQPFPCEQLSCAPQGGRRKCPHFPASTRHSVLPAWELYLHLGMGPRDISFPLAEPHHKGDIVAIHKRSKMFFC